MKERFFASSTQEAGTMWNQPIRRSPSKRTLPLTYGVVLLAAFGLCVSAASSQNQADRKTKAFHLTKDCSGFKGGVGSYCTIRSSNVKALKPGSQIFYFQAANPSALDSD